MSIFKEKYKYLFILLFLFFLNYCYAQKEYNSWVFDDSCSLIFDSGQLLVNTIPNGIDGSSDAVMCDKHSGELLFYSDGVYAYDKNGNYMPNGGGLKGCSTSSQTVLIVPNPKTDSTYYLFTTDCVHNGGYQGLNYNIVDMRLNGGLGDVTQKNIFVCNNESEKLTAVRACSFDGFWIITYVDSLLDFFTWRLTPNGITIDSPVISPSSFPGYNPSFGHDAGYLKASPNGNMLIAGFNELSDNKCTYLYYFDKNTGAISLITVIPSFNGGDQGDYGVSFSPDNSKAYFTNLNVAGSYKKVFLYQFDLNTNITTLIYQIVDSTNSYGLLGLQLAPDGKIYVTDFDFDSLGVINEPNLAGTLCDYNNDGVSVKPNILHWNLPNNVDALYYLDTLFKPNFIYSVNCANSTTAFTDNSNLSAQEWWWSFGDSVSGSSNHSKEQNPAHHFTAPGTYNVSMWAYEGCAVDSVIKTVTVAPCPPPPPPLIIPTIIYGNGNQTQWHIINLPQGNNAVILYDELGRTIYKSKNYPNDFDMRNLPPAMYFYRLTLEGGQEYTGKIVLVK